MMQAETTPNPVTVQLTLNDFLLRLQERVSQYDARLILHSALVVSGLKVASDSSLNRGEAEAICLELIKKGGPAFQVGTAIYREVLQ